MVKTFQVEPLQKTLLQPECVRDKLCSALWQVSTPSNRDETPSELSLHFALLQSITSKDNPIGTSGMMLPSLPRHSCQDATQGFFLNHISANTPTLWIPKILVAVSIPPIQEHPYQPPGCVDHGTKVWNTHPLAPPWLVSMSCSSWRPTNPKGGLTMAMTNNTCY